MKVLLALLFLVSLHSYSAKQKLADISVKYPVFGIAAKVGGGEAYVEVTDDGEIDQIFIKVDVGISAIGLSDTIEQNLSIEKLMAGRALSFYLNGAEKDTMIIEAQAGFDEFGGNAKVKINTDNRYLDYYAEVDVSIKKNSSGEYQIYQNGKAVKRLSITMKGMKVSNMYVGEYSFKH